MAIDFVEAGVGARTGEPAVKRRVAVIEGAAPGQPVRVPGRAREGGTAGSVQTLPVVTDRIAVQPGRATLVEPVQFTRSNGSVIGARVGQCRAALLRLLVGSREPSPFGLRRHAVLLATK